MRYIKRKEKNPKRILKLGATSEKILLLLEAGILLGLTSRPDRYFRILRNARKEWKNINERNLRDNVKRLYSSNMVACVNNKDGSTTLVLSEHGKKRVLHCHLRNISISRPTQWDGFWRIVIFDIPEKHKTGRDALSGKLKQLGFISLQKSVFILPYECKNEIDFLTEMFYVRSFVQYMTVKEVSNDSELRKQFKL